VKSDDSTLTTEPVVALASDADRARRRHVLGSPKDPFKPNATPTPTPKPEAPSAPAATVPGNVVATAPAGGGGSPVSTPGSPTGSPSVSAGSPSAPGFTTPMAPVTPKKKYELFELSVRFGASADTAPARRDVKRLEALPSADEPVLIYLGVLEDNKTAVFMVDSGVVAQGDGRCKPSRSTCETIELKEGETEFFDVPSESADGSTDSTPSAQYELDVLKLRKTVTTSAKKADAGLARVSTSGRKILRARIAGDGPLRYRYDAHSGKLQKLSSKAYKAKVAEVAKAAKAHF
jgi:hypothetical protein